MDVDVGNPELGILNKGKNDSNVHKTKSEYAIGKIDQLALPIFVDLFEKFEVPITFALRGQLAELENPSIDSLLNSSIKHDIGTHGYYHIKFEKISRHEAEVSVKLATEWLKRLGLTPRSFIFPANSVNHLDVLEKYGYSCYRGAGSLTKDVMAIKKVGNLINVCPSIYLQKKMSPAILKGMVDISVVRRLPLHFWLHLWNMGSTIDEIQQNIRNIMVPFLSYAKQKEKNGYLTFQTMLSAAMSIP
ncbi:MAG: polysaccharide deacetylase family protein [Candidatus Bathyarchaeia archaeon]